MWTKPSMSRMIMWKKPSMSWNKFSQYTSEYKCSLRTVNQSMNQCMESIEFLMISRWKIKFVFNKEGLQDEVCLNQTNMVLDRMFKFLHVYKNCGSILDRMITTSRKGKVGYLKWNSKAPIETKQEGLRSGNLMSFFITYLLVQDKLLGSKSS